MAKPSIIFFDSFEENKKIRALVVEKQGGGDCDGCCCVQEVESEDAEKMARGGWGAGLLPIAVGVCPTDEASVWGDFPTGVGTLKDREGVILGHEGVCQLVSWDDATKEALQKKGLSLGDIVIADINVGCGNCRNCKEGKPGIYCENGPVFVGVGATPEADEVGWPMKQTGRRHPGGYYREGVVYMPARAVHKVPLDNVEKPEDLYIFSQADGVACVKVIIRETGIIEYNDKYGPNSKPRVIVIGAGRLGTQAGLLLKDLGLPNGIDIVLVDNNQENLDRAKDLLEISDEYCYLVTDEIENPFSRRAFSENVPFLGRCSEREGFADAVIDTAGHGAISSKQIHQLFEENILGKGGRFATASHTGIPNGEGGTGVIVGNAVMSMNNNSIITVLSPQDQMADAIEYLGENIEIWRKNIKVLEGGLDYTTKTKDGKTRCIADVVGGLVPGIKNQMEGTTFIVPMVNNEKASEILEMARRG